MLLGTVLSAFLIVEVTTYRPLRFYFPFLVSLCILAGGLAPAVGAVLQRTRPRIGRLAAAGVASLVLLPAFIFSLAFIHVYDTPTARQHAQQLMRNRFTGRGDVVWQGIMFLPGVDNSRYVSLLFHGIRGPARLKRLWCDSEMIGFNGNLFWWDLIHGDESYTTTLGLEALQAFLRALDAEELGFRRIRLENYPEIGPFVFNDDWTEVSFSWFDHPPVTIYLRRSTPRWEAAEPRVDAVLAPFGEALPACAALRRGGGGEQWWSRRRS